MSVDAYAPLPQVQAAYVPPDNMSEVQYVEVPMVQVMKDKEVTAQQGSLQYSNLEGRHYAWTPMTFLQYDEGITHHSPNLQLYAHVRYVKANDKDFFKVSIKRTIVASLLKNIPGTWPQLEGDEERIVFTVNAANKWMCRVPGNGAPAVALHNMPSSLYPISELQAQLADKDAFRVTMVATMTASSSDEAATEQATFEGASWKLSLKVHDAMMFDLCTAPELAGTGARRVPRVRNVPEVTDRMKEFMGRVGIDMTTGVSSAPPSDV